MGDGRVRLLVCGERLRGDDGAALRAVAGLSDDARALAEIVEVGQLSVEALIDVPGEVAIIVADAAVGVAAGEVVTAELADVAEHGSRGVPASSHVLPPDQVLGLAVEMRGSPLRGVFVGIGGAEFGLGEQLSPAVERGLPALTTAIETEIRRLARG